MDGTMRAALDASIEDALQARILSKKRHGALIKAGNTKLASAWAEYRKDLGR